MTRGFFIGICIVGMGLAFSSCGSESPGSPDTAITAPTIQSPANGSTVDTLQPMLTVGNATGGTATVSVYRVLEAEAGRECLRGTGSRSISLKAPRAL